MKTIHSYLLLSICLLACISLGMFYCPGNYVFTTINIFYSFNRTYSRRH
jgi:hypothetical protein